MQQKARNQRPEERVGLLAFAWLPDNATDPMAILMGDKFERNIGKPYETPDIDVELGYRFDIVIGGRNATFFE